MDAITTSVGEGAGREAEAAHDDAAGARAETEDGRAEQAAADREAATRTTFADFEEARRALEPLMGAIAAVVGPHCEVVLHDLSGRDLDHSVRVIINGAVSGRSVGGPSTNLGIDVLRDEGADHDLFGYRGRTSDGRDLLSSSVYYRDHDGHVIAAFCINIDQTPVQSALTALSALVPGERAADGAPPRELVGSDIADVLEDMVEQAIGATGKPVPGMDKADRIEVLRELEARGAFRIKRAVETVSARLGVSRVTVYGYLDEIRRG